VQRKRNDGQLTAEKLRAIIGYDPVTGKFVRLVKPIRGKAKEGDPTIVTAQGHRAITVDGMHYLAQKLAWLHVYGKWPPGILTHLNGDKTDNRIANLALKGVLKGEGLTVERLKQVLDYDPTTGAFTWKTGTARGRPGEQAGALMGLGYRNIGVDATRYLAHRLAWFYVYGCWPEPQIDHINGNRDDNRIANLREATAAQNTWNGARKPGVTGFRGVRRKGNRYNAQIMAENRRISLGWFATAEEAAAAYDKARAKYHGEFGNGS
jgi:hypothetical protein